MTPPLVGVESGGDSFSDFFAASYDELVRALTLTLGDADLAADAVAEAMVKAHLRWNRLENGPNPAGWVYRVALNWARKRRGRRWRELTTAEPPEQPAPLGRVEDPGLERAIADLPVEQRAVVVLRHLLDWSEARTAEALDIPAGTVKSRLSRALETLAAALAHDEEDDDDE